MIINKGKTGLRRQSAARRVLLSELRMVRSHPSAEELFRLARRRIRGVSLATVYRNLDVLEKEGLVRKVNAGGSTRYDGDLFDHDHLVCERCGSIADVPSAVQPQTVRRVSAARDFDVKYVRAEFRGICTECRSKSNVKYE